MTPGYLDFDGARNALRFPPGAGWASVDPFSLGDHHVGIASALNPLVRMYAGARKRIKAGFKAARGLRFKTAQDDLGAAMSRKSALDAPQARLQCNASVLNAKAEGRKWLFLTSLEPILWPHNGSCAQPMGVWR
jgi:hypothetical protein